ncbi:MAG: hypothetical protein AMXMBFR34_17460 [Myxococcaceae bacterium]
MDARAAQLQRRILRGAMTERVTTDTQQFIESEVPAGMRPAKRGDREVMSLKFGKEMPFPSVVKQGAATSVAGWGKPSLD